MSCSKAPAIVMTVLLAALLAAAGAYADLFTMTGDNITVSSGPETITWGGNASGSFDGLVAVGATFGASNDEIRIRLSNFTAVGTIINVTYSVRMNSTMSNDNLAVSYSNDSGTTWFTANATGIIPPATLTIYGNYSAPNLNTIAKLNNSMVRLVYTRSGGTDSARIGIDGVMMFVLYAPPPNVTLTYPADGAWWTTSVPRFNFTPSSLIAFANCSLYINGTRNQTNQTPISNGTNNTINSTFADGDYLWNVSCLDTGGFTGTDAAARTIRIDTTPPTVTLIAPPDNFTSGRNLNNFTFNVTDAAAISVCRLVVDNAEKDSISSPTKGVDINLSASLTIGDHPWYINCTDANGWTRQSAIRNISIQITTPTIAPNDTSYEQGQTVLYVGSNWNAGANVSINVTLPNSTILQYYALANSTKNINLTHTLGYSYPTGSYSVTARQVNDSSMNASASYSVTARQPTVVTGASSYMQGSTVTITGTKFSPFTTVNITILFPGGRNATIVSANASGAIAYSYALAMDEQIAQHNISAIDLNYTSLNASTNFNVTLRTATVTANKTSYSANQSVGITGIYFPTLSSVLLQIYHTFTNRIAPGFPTAVASDAAGSFNYTWSVNSTCSGNYTVLAADEASGTSANTTFLVANSISSSYIRWPDGASGAPTSPVLANVNTSDGTLHTVGLSATALTGYINFNFLPSIPVNSTMGTTTFTIEHRRTSNKVTTYDVYWWNGASWSAVTGCTGLTPPDVETNQSCDISAVVTNYSRANNLLLSVNYTRSGGGGGDMEVDSARVNYSWTGDPYGCYSFGDTDTLPVVSGMSVTPSSVVLTPGSTKAVVCNFTVTDGNGASDITGANATFFTSPSTATSLATNVSKYENASCNQTANTTNTKSYSCSVQLLYYATNGTWYCNGTGVTAGGSGSSTRSFTVDPLYALSVGTDLISFGNMAGGSLSTDVQENVLNYGNQRINVSALGYGGALGDNNSFNCQTFNISASALRYSLNSTTAYAQKQNLTGSFRHTGMTMASAVNASGRVNSTYWQFQMPDGNYTFEQCNGTIILQAELG